LWLKKKLGMIGRQVDSVVFLKRFVWDTVANNQGGCVVIRTLRTSQNNILNVMKKKK